MKKFLKLAVVLSAGIFICLTGCKKESVAVELSSFSFERRNNIGVNGFVKTVNADIDNERGIVTVHLPEDLFASSDDRKELKATVVAADGCAVVTNVSNLDFSISPISIAVSNMEGESRNFIVVIKPVLNAVRNGDLLFTEYYSGAEYNYRGANNQYIEIYNNSDSDIDLAAVQLVRHSWKNGVRNEANDQSVTLRGILPSGCVYVLYSQRCAYFSSSTNTSSKKFESDRAYNGIISLSGQDGLALYSNGKMIDAIGPDNGNGISWNWGNAKKLQRKTDVKSFSKFKFREWITTKSENQNSESNTAGVLTDDSNLTAKNITYFALEQLSIPVYGTVDHSKEPEEIKVKLNEGMSSVTKPSVSTDGDRVRYKANGSSNFVEFLSGETVVDLSKSPVFRTYDNSGNYKDFVVKLSYLHYEFNSDPYGEYSLVSQKPMNGDVVMIYHPSSGNILGSNASGSKLASVSASLSSGDLSYEDGMASLAVTVDDDDHYLFTCNGKFLTSSATGQGLSFVETPTDYSLWDVEVASGNNYYIKNVNAKYGTKIQSLEYYSGFTTYNHNTTAAYQFQFIKKN